ncbi:MAG: hypothetical protein ACFFAH_01365 [Promethearchaeota archaeon]
MVQKKTTQKVKCPYCGKELVKIGGHYRTCTKKKKIDLIVYTIGISSIVLVILGITLMALYFFLESIVGLVGLVLSLIGGSLTFFLVYLLEHFTSKKTRDNIIFISMLICTGLMLLGGTLAIFGYLSNNVILTILGVILFLLSPFLEIGFLVLFDPDARESFFGTKSLWKAIVTIIVYIIVIIALNWVLI